MGAEAVPWDYADAQVNLQEDLALVRVSAEALGVALNDVGAAICAAGGDWRAAMQVGLRTVTWRPLPTQQSAQLGRGSAAVCCLAGGGSCGVLLGWRACLAARVVQNAIHLMHRACSP